MNSAVLLKRLLPLLSQRFHNKRKVLSLLTQSRSLLHKVLQCFVFCSSIFLVQIKSCVFALWQSKRQADAYNLRHLIFDFFFFNKNSFLWEYFALAHHMISNCIICGLLIFFCDPFDCLYFLPFHLLSWNSCLMRRSKTAKRMNRAEWVPEVQNCPCASVLWLAVLVIIRENKLLLTVWCKCFVL